MENTFLEIVDDHQGIIHKVCLMYRDTPEDQEDLFQEIVLQLWKAFPAFRGEAKISTWVYRIALNTAIVVFRKKQVQLDVQEAPLLNDISSEHENPSDNEDRLFEALRRLGKAERAIIALFLEGYSYKEIGEISGITENYVAVKISRIKQKLKNILT